MSDQPTLGGKLGGRIASLTSAATVATRAAMAPHTVSVAMQIQDAFFRLVGSEIRATLGEPMARIADAPNAPAWVAKTFNFLARGHGQWQGFLMQSVGGAALGTGLGTLLTNELTPVIGEIIRTNPNLYLSPDIMAALVARGKVNRGVAEEESAKQGINSSRFSHLVDANRRAPDMSTLLTAYRRGLITRDYLGAGLRDAGIEDFGVATIMEMIDVPLSPADAADMVQRGIIDEKTGRSIASMTGVNATDFDRLALASGQPLSLQDLLFLYRRGKINRARLEHGIRQGNTRNEWIPEAELLGVVPMSTADAIAATVQGHLDAGTAKRIAQENGLEPDHFQPLLDTAGEPLSRTEMVELWNRGEVSQGDVEQALRESRLKNKYIPAVLKLRRYILPPDTIRMMYEHHVIDKATALRMLADRGLTAEDSAYYLQLAVSAKMATSRDLTESMIRQLYTDQAISRDVAVKNLVNLGYDESEAGQILSISEFQRNQRMRDSAVSRVHARFVAHRIDETQAVTALDALHIPTDQRDAYVDTWNVERDLNVPSLTVAQMNSAMKKGLITPSDMFGRLLNLGYTQSDARIIVELGGGAL